MIAIVDYGMGNLRSVSKAFESLGAEVEVTSSRERIAQADKVVFPGVGAFGDCIRNLERGGLVEAVREAALSERPFLGICLGLQALFDESEEGGLHRGLGILRGKVRRFQKAPKVPHMGWNEIEFAREEARGCPLLKGVPSASFVYFVHSYYGVPEDSALAVTETEYGERFVSTVWRGNLFATQFHPEKSQAVGLAILKNFAAL